MSDLSHALPEARSDILRLIKRHGAMAAGTIATHLGITREAARQQLKLLEQHGWVTRAADTDPVGVGRPEVRFVITHAADHLFPKRYDELSMALVDTIAEQFGEDALTQLLTRLTDQQVQQWESTLEGKSFAEKLEALRGIYFQNDPHTKVEHDENGYLLVENNCPYLHVAMQRPRLCSVTVSTLTRLLGVKVVREKRFQDGDQRCAFRVRSAEPVNRKQFRFAYESDSVKSATDESDP